MSDWYYRIVRDVGYHAFFVSSSPLVLHKERVPRRGACLIAPTHFSAYDIPCLMATIRRPLDFVSIQELFEKPLVKWFFTNMNAMPLERRRVDPKTTRMILERLEKGRAVVMFPEGRIRDEKDSVLAGGTFKSSALRLARIAAAPIIPCVIVNTGVYTRVSAWAPLRRTRYGVAFGEAIVVEDESEEKAAAEKLRAAYLALHAELYAAAKGRIPMLKPLRQADEKSPSSQPSPGVPGEGEKPTG